MLSFLIFPAVSSTSTLYGGSVRQRFAFFPSIRTLKVSGSVESPQTTLCSPRSQTSPSFDFVGFFSSSSTSKSSSWISLLCTFEKSCSISGGSKPVRSVLKFSFCRSTRRSARSCSSHAPVILLSATFRAFTFAGSSICTTTHCTVS